MSGAKDETGNKYGRLVVLRRGSVSAGRVQRWVCLCDCGNQKEVSGAGLRNGSVASCGCLLREHARRIAPKKHGLSGTPTYISWQSMNLRCYCESNASFPHYGGAGVTVCERWRASFENFLADMGERPAGLTLDRIENALGYEPGNCRWADKATQQANRSPTIWLTVFGRTLPLAAWSAESGIRRDTITRRLERGWSPERALSAPIDAKRHRHSFSSAPGLAQALGADDEPLGRDPLTLDLFEELA